MPNIAITASNVDRPDLSIIRVATAHKAAIVAVETSREILFLIVNGISSVLKNIWDKTSHITDLLEKIMDSQSRNSFRNGCTHKGTKMVSAKHDIITVLPMVPLQNDKAARYIA